MDQPRPGGKMNRRRFLKTAAGTTAGAALTAWSLEHPAPARAAADRARAAEPNPKRGGVLKWAGPAEVAHFDVHQGAFRFVLGQMHNNLVRFNPADGLKTIIPDLAESWKVSTDGKTYTFKLRDGVKFHDGTAFSSADVVATFSRIIFPPRAWPASTRTSSRRSQGRGDRPAQRAVRPQGAAAVLPRAVDALVDDHLLQEDARREQAGPPQGDRPRHRRLHVQGAQGRREVGDGAEPELLGPGDPLSRRHRVLHIPAWTDRGTAVLSGQADYSPNVSLETHQEGTSARTSSGPCGIRASSTPTRCTSTTSASRSTTPACGARSTWRSAGRTCSRRSAPRSRSYSRAG